MKMQKNSKRSATSSNTSKTSQRSNNSDGGSPREIAIERGKLRTRHGYGAISWGWARSRRWQRSLMEPENLKHLIGAYLIGHPTTLSVPCEAAGSVAITGVLPGSACIGSNSPVIPEPLAIWIRILPSLH